MALSIAAKRKVLNPEDAYRDIVHPVLRAMGLVPQGSLINAEGKTQDMRAGIDWIVSAPDGTQVTIGSRVQWGRDYGTFSMRYRTAQGHLSEFAKRYRSVMAGGSYPTLTVQAYVVQDTGLLLNAYVVRTEDLYRHVVASISDDDTFVRCNCVSRPRMVPGGAQMMLAAITEAGKVHANVRGTLIAHGIRVQMTAAQAIGQGLGL